MPYIEPTRRHDLDAEIEALAGRIYGPGALHYAIARLLHLYARRYHSLNYDRLNEVVGVLAGAQLEFYRTVIAPYEDKKRAEHGPVSELDGTIHP